MAVKFEGVIVALSMRAMLFRSHYWENPEWMPFSQITVKRGDGEHIISVSEWLAGKKGLKEMEYRGKDEGVPQDV